MKTVSIMRAQHNLSEVLRTLGPGERVGIMRNKKIVAELVAPDFPHPPVFPDFAARARATWGSGWKGTSTDQLLDETRGGR
ncbi:MAG: type II toxin-antitoxin system Phd/YefM family antitoxin [Puniceicoccaceae bacterium]